MRDILKLVRVQLMVTVLFVIFKLIRKRALESDPSDLVRAFLFSFPNFCEGVIGVMALASIGVGINQWFKFRDGTLYVFVTLLATVYVITQELKWHNLGGRNVYDPNDVLSSLIGLATGYLILRRIRPSLNRNTGAPDTD